ncbi:thioredoxin reductase [Streptosporangium album]|uniref:Thioredoxin reductase n=1 Tax=Streptosporangium album TaxID=47479 RepID=A0A7W7W7C1_9ACTN|nr:FAD-binding protein [Streptosporangium album]MBB4935879.1 thioredoxin reductase [Streptosporangium album]
MVTDQLRDGYDVVVFGGGAAGLSGALMLARARRPVVVIDAGAQGRLSVSHAPVIVTMTATTVPSAP